ncbi:MAG: hypothetical protein JJU20_10815, partial [Opitutales bacterium]|nr:hypothetical protein [Opitutales bacterium]
KKEPKPSVGYQTDGRGRWWRLETQPQCSDKDIFRLECQGVWGHKGVHWAYKQDGSYAYWKNDSDPDSIGKDVGAGWTPPEHESYIDPRDKRSEYFRNHHSVDEVKDSSLIKKLESEEPPEEGAFIDRPLLAEEIQHLKDTGRL